VSATNYEQAGELKIGQVGIANLRIRTLDVERLVGEMRERVERAPKLFGRAAVIVDFGGLVQTPDVDTARALIEGLRQAGVLPVALAYGTRENDALAEALGLPVLAKFRAQYEPSAPTAAPPRPRANRPRHPVPPCLRRPRPSRAPRAGCRRPRCGPASRCTPRAAT
jgi:Septum formation inhibitor